MGNRFSLSDNSEEEAQPILSNAFSGVQSGESGYVYGYSNLEQNNRSEAVPPPASQNGRPVSRSYKLKTEERKGPNVVRRPFIHSRSTSSLNSYAPLTESQEVQYEEDASREAFARRLRYFSRLDRRPDSTLAMPDHVVPDDFWVNVLGPAEAKQHSLITIFSLWNTMMGTSLLSMPWAIQQAGFIGGVTLLMLMALIMFYTSYLVLNSVNSVPGQKFIEFSDVCGHFLGKYARALATLSSLVTLMGGMIVYWILLSNFLYNIVVYIHDSFVHVPSHKNMDFISSSDLHNTNNNSHLYSDVVCPGNSNSTDTVNGTDTSTFDKVWTEHLMVPLLLTGLLIFLVNFKSATIFTKLNSLGVASVLYLLLFTCLKAAKWGFHLDLGWDVVPSDDHPYYTPDIKATFPALTGICALAYFVQNCVIAITRNNKHQENNVRDLSIAYFLVAFCYIFVGAMVFVSFPLNKSCIEDNFLNNIGAGDVTAFVAHILLFFQMSCVFPLLTFILRSQFLQAVSGTPWPSFKHVIVLNVTLFVICILFAIFLPHIGQIIGFVGAFCGLAYAIALPCCVFMVYQYRNGKLTWWSFCFHTLLVIIGALNFIAQFLIIGKTS